MLVRKATEKDKKEALKIAQDLKEWFNSEGIRNMRTDFYFNSLIVAVDIRKIIGFLCYTSYCGKMQILWMGVERKSQGKGVGKRLLEGLEKEAKKYGLVSIEVETLPEEDSYEPYKKTREFYYKNGFKRVLYKKARIKGWDDQIVLEKIIK